MAQMCQVAVVVVVCLATTGYGGPLGDIAAPVGPTKDSQLARQQQDTKIPQKEGDSSLNDNSPQPQDNSGFKTSYASRMLSPIDPPNAIRLPVTRNALGGCNMHGKFPDPAGRCRYFYMCLPIEPEYEMYMKWEYMCEASHTYDEMAANCVEAECLTVQSDDGIEGAMPPAQSSSQVPSWFDEAPAWFKTPPAWFQTPPAWLGDKINVEAGPGLEIGRPDQISKYFGTSNESSIDNKTLRINIPIKIVQQ